MQMPYFLQVHVSCSGTVAGSPLLLYNICSDSSDAWSESTTFMSLRPSPFGSRQPAIPVARAVTIARVASPVATDRAYQTLFLHSLKSFFESSRHLVKNGDMIAVSLDTDIIDQEATSTDGHYFSDTNKTEHEWVIFSVLAENSCSPRRTRREISPLRANEVVFFTITNIEYDVIQNDATTDVYVGSTLGELGCWVDPSITRMIQTGIQHAWIPELGKYIELGDYKWPEYLHH